MTDLIQSNYEQLSAVAKRFERSSTAISTMCGQLNQRIGRVRQSWQGVGATAFLTEWERAVNPALLRLIQALDHAGATTQQINRIVFEAEQAAARLFQHESVATSAQATTPVLLTSDANDAVPQVPQWLLDLLEVAVLGDFSDKMSLPGILAQILIGIIPGVGQIADIRDIIAGVANVLQGDEFAGLFLVLAIVAIIPGLDAVKAAKALKPILRALGNEGIQEIVEFIAKNPSEIGRVAQTLGGMLDNPKVIQAFADNPHLMMGLIRHGSPEAMEAIVKGGDDAIAEISKVATIYGDDGGYIIGNYDRYEILAKDPAHGSQIQDQFRIDKGRNEAAVALALEGRGNLPSPMVRSTDPKADFMTSGDPPVLWDVKGFNSDFPPRMGGFEVNTAMGQIQRELGNQENVIIDTQKMTEAHIRQLQQAILNDPTIDPSRILWYP